MDRNQLLHELLKVRANSSLAFTDTRAVCPPVGAASTTAATLAALDYDSDDEDRAIEAYRSEQASEGTGGGPQMNVSQYELQCDLQNVFGPSLDPAHGFGNDWEGELALNETPIELRTKGAQPPRVLTRGTIDRTKYTCFSCGGTAADLQMPADVFGTAYTKHGPVGGISALKAFGEALVKRDYEEAITRTACCRKLQCMLAQGKLTTENYATWRFSGKDGQGPRMQLERGTERMDQGLIFSDNILLLRWIFLLKDEEGNAVLSKEEIGALFHWVVLNSRFVQEREMRYIATAMAIVESASFPFTFADPQAFVDRMSGVPRVYSERCLLDHIFDTTRNVYHWTSWGNRLLETAYPKAADAAYLLVCRENWICQNSPRCPKGRPVHRVAPDAPHKDLFTAEGFQKALASATRENPTYLLRYESAATTNPNDVKGLKSKTRDETRALLKAVSGSHRSGPLKANGVKGTKCAPTDGALQMDSSVHTRQRYEGACEGLGFEEAEKAQVLALMIDDHTKGNSVGHEKLKGVKADRTKSKACAVLRRVEIVAPPPRQYTSAKRRLAAEALENLPTAVARHRFGAGTW